MTELSTDEVPVKSGLFSSMFDLLSAMSGLFSTAMSAGLLFGSIGHLFVRPQVIIGCPVSILIIIFTYSPSMAIHKTLHEQVHLQTTTLKGVKPDSSFASSTRT